MALLNLARSLFPMRVGLPPPGARFRGMFGFPADFPIATDGQVVAHQYGAHAEDGWSVNELLSLVRQHDLQ